MLRQIIFDHQRSRRYQGLHIEVAGCIVNIRPGLTTMDGEDITSIEIICDNNCDERWRLPDLATPDHMTVLGTNVRVVKEGSGYPVVDELAEGLQKRGLKVKP